MERRPAWAVAQSSSRKPGTCRWCEAQGDAASQSSCFPLGFPFPFPEGEARVVSGVPMINAERHIILSFTCLWNFLCGALTGGAAMHYAAPATRSGRSMSEGIASHVRSLWSRPSNSIRGVRCPDQWLRAARVACNPCCNVSTGWLTAPTKNIRLQSSGKEPGPVSHHCKVIRHSRPTC